MRAAFAPLLCGWLGIVATATCAATPPPVRVVRPAGPNGPVYGCFGASVAISGPYAFVGDPCEDSNTLPGAGAVYRLRRHGASWIVDWRQETINPAFGGRFGASIAINRNRLGVGAPGEGAGGYLYEIGGAFDAQPGPPWPRTPLILPPLSSFGISVVAVRSNLSSMFGDFLVGAPSEPCTSSSSANGFIASLEWNWKVCAPTLDSYANFGATLAIHGSLALIGAPGSNLLPGTAGAGYLYELGIPVMQPSRLVSVFVPTDPNRDRRFGASLAMNASTIVFGAPLEPGGVSPVSGNVWIYGGAVPNWGLVAVLSEPAAQPSREFGSAIALTNGTLLVGSPTRADGGAIYEYAQSPDGWNLVDTYLAAPEDTYGRLGASLAVDGVTWIAGAPSVEADTGMGAVYIAAADYLFESDFDR